MPRAGVVRGRHADDTPDIHSQAGSAQMSRPVENPKPTRGNPPIRPASAC